MNVYIYRAELLCEVCGEHVRDCLQGHPDEPADYQDESSYDSDYYPKGPYPNGGGEADTPQHCGRCGEFLQNPLTEDGARYVNTLAIPYMDESELAWSEIADRADKDGKPALAEWIRYYFVQGVQ